MVMHIYLPLIKVSIREQLEKLLQKLPGQEVTLCQNQIPSPLAAMMTQALCSEDEQLIALSKFQNWCTHKKSVKLSSDSEQKQP